MNLEVIRQKAIPVLKQQAIRRAGVFGSTARGDAEPRDLDLLVDMPRPYSLFKFLALKNELEDVLDIKVDLVDYDTIKPRIKERILQEEVRIL